MAISLIRATNTHEDFQALVQLLDANLAARNGDLQVTYSQYNASTDLAVVVLAYHDGQAVGCGGLKRYDDHTGEVKRMFVKPDFRGMGIASQILGELEQCARDAGFTATILETGKMQIEALRFYPKNGYQPIPNYGQYADLPNSVCFTKRL